MFSKKKSFKMTRTTCILASLLVILAWVTWFSLESARLVSEKMGDKTWKISSKVYSSPVTLFPGVKFSSEDIEKYLESHGYGKIDKGFPLVGQWMYRAGRYVIHHRSYFDGNQAQSPEVIAVGIERGMVSSLAAIKDYNHETPLDSFSLEPNLIGVISDDQFEERTLLRFDQIPRTLIDGIIQMEDRQFYSHSGVSLRGIFRALAHNVFGRSGMQGGSTLTQQLMKNFFLTQERTVWRKVREIIMTLVAEALYSKEQILEAYVNEIYLGQNGKFSIHGFEEASNFYFAKPLSATTLGEQSLLVGLISSPGRYSPYKDKKKAIERRSLVLKVLKDSGKITSDAYDRAYKEPMMPRGKREASRSMPYFLDYVKSELSLRFSDSSLRENGYTVLTSVDPRIQSHAEEAVRDGMIQIDKRVLATKNITPDLTSVEVALVALHPQTGAIKAMIGGRDYSKSQFNRAALAKRQPGSSVKPFVVALALNPLEDGTAMVTPSTLVSDKPTTFSYAGQEWAPKNFNGKYYDEVTVRQLLEKSLNVATVNLAAKVGLDPMSRFFEKLGFEKVSPVPSMAIGALEVTPLHLASAYTLFANSGLKSQPLAILSVLANDQSRLEQKSPVLDRVISKESAYMTTHIMEGIIDHGSARSARALGLKGAFAGKTGTTNDTKDNWFVGFSRDLVVVVWVGYDHPESIGLTGSATALQIWTSMMKKIYRQEPAQDFTVPEGVEFFEVDFDRGCVMRQSKNVLREAFLSGTTPPKCRP